MKIITLATCFNRREKTIRALSSLFSQSLTHDVKVSHFIVDDGSTDGTSDAISQLFPTVNLISGTGQLYWAGGMLYGFNNAIKSLDYDYLFVYNDDVVFYADALQTLLSTSLNHLEHGNYDAHLIAGSFLDSAFHHLTYGGIKKCSSWHPLRFSRVMPDPTCALLVDSINMNGCLISRAAIEKVGFLSSYFIHAGADFEYGLKLRKEGGLCILAPGFIGVCDLNKPINLGAMSYIQRCSYLLGPKCQPIMQRLHYYRRHAGLFWPFFFILPYLRLLKLW